MLEKGIFHAGFVFDITVNVVPNESTPFLVGLGVIRDNGLVIDYHYPQPCSEAIYSFCQSLERPPCSGDDAT